MPEETKVADIKPAKARAMHPSRFKEADQVRKIWAVVPEHGTSFEDVLGTNYWSHIAKNLHPGDLIEVFPEDNSYFARLIVRAVGRVEARVAVLEKHDLDEPEGDVGPTDIYRVKWRGMYHKHSVVRIADNVAIQTGFDTKEAALEWMLQHARGLAA